MICINSENTDPYFNLATEEYLLKNSDDNIFMLWCSTPSVIVGKHQNALGELNFEYIDEHNIRIARRLSGGGTVYHDKGNLNFTFIVNGEKGKLVDFKKFITPIMNILVDMGLDIEYGKRNDLFIDTKKVSGNAEHVFKKRTLHHGTLLLHANLNHLRNSIKITPGKYTDKAVKSVRSSVANISDYLTTPIEMESFRKNILHSVLNKTPGASMGSLKEDEIKTISELIKEKYNTWEWIFGYSPKFTFHNTIDLNNKKAEIDMFVEKGIIKEVQISGSGTFEKSMTLLSKNLIGKKQEKKTILTEIKKVDHFDDPLLTRILFGFF